MVRFRMLQRKWKLEFVVHCKAHRHTSVAFIIEALLTSKFKSVEIHFEETLDKKLDNDTPSL